MKVTVEVYAKKDLSPLLKVDKLMNLLTAEPFEDSMDECGCGCGKPLRTVTFNTKYNLSHVISMLEKTFHDERSTGEVPHLYFGAGEASESHLTVLWEDNEDV